MSQSFSEFTLHPQLPKTAFTEQELLDLEEVCNVRHMEADDGKLELWAEEYYHEQDNRYDPSDNSLGPIVNMVEILQAALARLDEKEYPAIFIAGSWHASNMDAGEYGGFAYWIRRTSHEFFSTHDWLRQKAREDGVMNDTQVLPAYLPNAIL